MYAPTLCCYSSNRRAVYAAACNIASLSSNLFDISFYRGAIDSPLHCIYLLSFGRFITLEVIPNYEAERLVTIIYYLWRVFEVLMRLSVNIVMYNSVQIPFRLKCKTYFNWDLVTDTEDDCFRTWIACSVVDRDTHVTNFPDLQHTNVCERNYIWYYGYFLQFFLNIWIFNLLCLFSFHMKFLFSDHNI